MTRKLGAILAAFLAIPTISQASDSVVRGLAIWGDEATRPQPVDGATSQYVDTLFTNANGPLLQDGSNNSAEIMVSSIGGLAVLMQLGDRNIAGLTISGDASSGMILQDGTSNFGSLDIPSTSSSAVIEQVGNRNAADLVVLSNGTTVLYRQVGNDLGSTEPMTVDTNAGSIQIMTTEN